MRWQAGASMEWCGVPRTERGCVIWWRFAVHGRMVPPCRRRVPPHGVTVTVTVTVTETAVVVEVVGRKRARMMMS